MTSTTLDGIRRTLERAGVEFVPDGVRRRWPTRPGEDGLFQDLRTISLHSAERLRGREPLIDTDLYDEDGLPA